MEDEELYRGRFEHVGDRQLRSVRIFVSSTFSDTTEERNGLIELVYPKLREYCLTKYQIQFQYSDMRWGIQSTASSTHSTVDMCLQELDTCSRLSLATNCVILLSHRYGSRLIPASIPSHIFHQLQESLSSNPEEKNFLSQMYQLDENYLEKKYFLRPVDDDQQWISLENKLQNLLRKSADLCYQQGTITKDERNEFFISVTAKEIYRALANNSHSSRRIVCFFREIIDIDQLDSKYRETENVSESQELIEEMKNVLHQSIDSSDIYTYQIQWTDEVHRKKYFSQFYDDFYQAIKSQIDFHMKSSANQGKNLLYNQILEHALQCNLLTQRYFPRKDILEQIKSYVTSTTNAPCVLLGESGTGKSSIMAKLVSEIPTWFSQANSVSVIIRFLGATPSSSDIRRPLISIIEQICAIYHLDRPVIFDVVKENLEKILMNIPKNQQLILLLDSLDQLEINDLKNLSKWLPSSTVKCIFSSISSIEIERETIDIQQQLQSIYQQNLIEIEVKPFDENLAEQVLYSWLEQDRRCLTTIQHEWLKPKITIRHHITPLFLSLLYDQTLTWHSYDQTSDRAFLAIKQTSDAIGYLYNQLGNKHGPILFRRSMRYLQLSGGLNELEMEDILSLDDDILQSVFVHYLPPFELFRLPSTLWIRIRNDMHKYLVEKDIDNIPCIYFYHRSFQYYQPMNAGQLIIENEEKVRMEKNRLDYFAYQYKDTFDMNYSPKLAKKYNLTSTIIPVQRCLTAQKALKHKKKNQFNLRRLHQLYININRYDFAHTWTIFNYEFLSTYLSCGEYQMSDLLYQFSIGAHDPNGELRFLLKHYERSMSILNEYPNNLPFELIYRLYPFLHQLPDLTYNLLNQCLDHCPLQLLTDNERRQCLAKYSLSKILCLTLDSHRLFVLTDQEKLYVFYYNYYGILMVEPFDIIYNKTHTNEQLISFLCQYPYVCCLSSHSSMVVINREKQRVSMQVPCRQLISFINEEIVLIISSTNNGLELWDCAANQLKSQYHLPDNPIDECTFQNSIIQVRFQGSSMISSLSIDKDFHFNPIRMTNENIDHQILLDTHIEFRYSNDHSQTSLILSHENPSQEIIDFHSPPKSVTYLPQSNSIAWLTTTSLMLLHPLMKEKLFQPFSIISSISSMEYDLVHDHYSSLEFRDQTNFLACFNRTKQIIDIYEWRYDTEQHKHIYRQLTRLQLDVFVDRFVFTANWFDGITIYLSDGSNLYKYNATMVTYLLASKPLIASPMINQVPTTYSNEYLAMLGHNHLLKILSLNEDNTLLSHLSIDSIREYYFTKTSSHILVINEQNHLSIYSLKTSKLSWTTDQFAQENLRIHPLDSSFIWICLTTKQIFLIDTNSFELKNLLQIPKVCLLSTVTSNNRLYILPNDQQSLLEINIINTNLTEVSLTELHSKKIKQLYSVFDQLVFHTDDEQIYLWWKTNERIDQLEKASHFISKDHRFVLVSIDNPNLILYDLQEKLRGTIPLDEDAGQCEAIELSDLHSQSEQYLFTICHDRFLRMYCVSNGKQLAKLFLHANLSPFIAIIQHRILLHVDDQLCIIKIIDRKTIPNRLSNEQNPLFEQSMWMTCHHDRCVWSDVRNIE